MQQLLALPPSVRACLGDFARRYQRLALLRASGWALAVFLGWLLICCAADRLFHLPGSIRAVLLALGAGGGLVIIAWPIHRLRGPIDWVSIAEAIERQNPSFDQRLVTVTSQLLDSPENRGSREILSHLSHEVEILASSCRRTRPAAGRGAVRAWGVCALIALATVGLAHVPVLGMQQLMLRFVRPGSGIPPVTTTHLVVSPGDRDLTVSRPLHIAVQATHLANETVWVHLSDDNENWTRSTMEAAGDGKYTFDIGAVERDMRYYVTAGDAVSARYTARVKRPPVVSEFRVRYSYPAYTGRQPLTLVNTDGLIEAPKGSEALLTVVATEPLQSVMLTLNGEKILMEPAGGDTMRQLRIAVDNDATYELDLISAREVHGSVQQPLRIRATLDRPPLVRLLQGNQSLRLSPGDMIPLNYQALDDFGLKSLDIGVRVNDLAAFTVPVGLLGDRRRQEDLVNFDLASLHLMVGDVVSITIAAHDSAGQFSASDPLQVLVAPHAVDLDGQARINELNGAAQLAAMLADEWVAVGRAYDEASQEKDRQSSAYLSAAGRGNRRLTSASELGSLLRQSLLRAIIHSSSPELSTALANWVDIAQLQSIVADDLFRLVGVNTGTGNMPRNRARQALDAARRALEQIRVAAEGERAKALLADRGNLVAIQARSAPPDLEMVRRLAKMIEDARTDITTGADEIGLDASSNNFDEQLREKTGDETNLLEAAAVVDFGQVATDWSRQIRRESGRHGGFDMRLSSAAQAENARPDADLIRVRDLNLASRAATNLEAAAPEAQRKRTPITGLTAFVDAMAVLQQDFLLNRGHGAGPATGEKQPASNSAAVKAREELARLAGEPGTIETNDRPGLGAVARNKEAVDLAIRASAEAANHNYPRVTELDNLLATKLTEAARSAAASDPGRRGGGEQPAAAFSTALPRTEDRVDKIERIHQSIVRSMSAAETADRLGHSQEELENDLNGAGSIDANELVMRQRSVADAIARAEREHLLALAANSATTDDDQNWRELVTSVLLTARQDLAAMPAALSAVQAAADARRDADVRVERARRDLAIVPPDHKAAAQRAVDQSTQDAADAAERLRRALLTLSPKAAHDLAERLKPLSPEATGAQDVIADSLATAFAALEQGAQVGDDTAIERAAGDARRAIDLAQAQLARAQEAYVQRDPLVAAKWFARAAADSLSRSPGDLKTALAHQNNVTIALSRAWDRSIHRAAAQRMTLLPSMQGLYGPGSSTINRQPTVAAPVAPNFATSREWGNSRPRNTDEANSAMATPDPPGYEESLRLYFEAIGKAQAVKSDHQAEAPKGN